MCCWPKGGEYVETLESFLRSRSSASNRMINRKTLRCISCGTRITTRTGIGHAVVQKHKFPCPTCKVEIGYILDVGQEEPSLEYREPTNAKWDDGDGESEHMLLFYPEVMIPRNLEGFISPFVVTVGNHKDIVAYQKEEALRRNFKDKQWPVLQRVFVHFENGNLELIRKEAGALAGRIPDLDEEEKRGEWIVGMTRYFFDFFIADPQSSNQIEKSIALAYRKNEGELRGLASKYVKTGRMSALWKELKSIRREFMMLYESLLPLLMVRRYWRDDKQDIGEYQLSVKNFEDLKGLYIDTVETSFRLLVVGLAVELIATTGKPVIKTKAGGNKNIWWFEQMNNGIKGGQLDKHPVLNRITPALDLGLRNGAGHNSAHYDANSDQIVYVKGDDDNLNEVRLSYTLFVDKVFKAYCAFELLTVYFQWFFVAGGGKL
jgi:hypothetical protein